MKNYRPICLILLLVVLSMAHRTQAQIFCPKDYRKDQLKRWQAVELTVGPKPWRGIVGSAGFVYYFHCMKGMKDNRFPTFYAKGNVYYAMDQRYGIDHRAYVAEIGGGIIPFTLFRRVFPSLIAGGLASYDRPAQGSHLPQGIASELTEFKTGFFAGAEVLIFLGHPRLALLVTYSQRFLNGKNWGDQRTYTGVGIRWHFSDMSFYTTYHKKSGVGKSRTRHKMNN